MLQGKIGAVESEAQRSDLNVEIEAGGKVLEVGDSQ